LRQAESKKQAVKILQLLLAWSRKASLFKPFIRSAAVESAKI
jgi:hypothetical protein